MADPTAQRVWDAALGQLQIHVTRPNYDTWLKDTRGLRVEDGHFVVGVPTEFVKEWLGTRMRGLVSQTIGGILGQPTDVSFEILAANGNGHSPTGHSPSVGNGRGHRLRLLFADGVNNVTVVSEGVTAAKHLVQEQAKTEDL